MRNSESTAWLTSFRPTRQRQPSRRKNRASRLEALERRELLAVAPVNLHDVPLLDGERKDASAPLLNYLGGNFIVGSPLTVSLDTAVVHSGAHSYRVDTSGAIAAGSSNFVQITLGASGFALPYTDTRDLTHYQSSSVWLRNATGAAFTLTLELKDYRDNNAQRAQRSQVISAADLWTKIQVPLDLSQGWTVTGNPDLTRARALSFIIDADQGAAVAGSVYIDDLVLTEPGGTLDPNQVSSTVIADEITRRQFDALWGSRDRTTGLLPTLSSFENVVALNTTAALVKSLPGAVSRDWLTQTEADTEVSAVAQSLGTMLNGGHRLPARYVDRVTLAPTYVLEESPVDAGLMYLAMFQYEFQPGTPAGLSTTIGQTLARFDFASFATSQGWRLAYDLSSSSFTTGTYNGYSGEIGLMSLAADLAGQVDMGAMYHSGVNRTLMNSLSAPSQYLVHSNDQFQSPFSEWLFPLFVDVAGRGPDNYPVPSLASNPWDNAVRYQIDVDQRLAASGRATLVQPDAGDDYTGTVYHAYSVFDNFGKPSLLMPWSVGFAFLADPVTAGAALRELVNGGLQGPFGLVDSAYWDTGQPAPYDVAARNDLWNTSLSLMALSQYLYGDNQFLTALPAVQAALAKIFQPQAAVTPPAQFILGSTRPNTTSDLAADLGSSIVSVYSDFSDGAVYLNPQNSIFVLNGTMDFDGDDPDAGHGRSSWRTTLTTASGAFEFHVAGAAPRDIPDFGLAHELRFMAKGDAVGQEVEVLVVQATTSGTVVLPAVKKTLTTAWQDFSVDLPANFKPSELSGVQFRTGPAFGLNAGNKTFRIDELRLDTDGVDPLRVVRSYQPLGWASDQSPVGTPAYRDAFVYPKLSSLYDNALAIKALWATGEAAARATAKRIADALIATNLPNGSYDNQRANGHTLFGSGTPRGPLVSSQTLGDNAWFGLALLDVYTGTGDVSYLNRARQISDWAETNLRDTGPLGGYQFAIGDNTRSTEQNIDSFSLNWRIAVEMNALNDSAAATYADRASWAGNFVLAMFDSGGGKFWTGTPSASDQPNMSSVPLDVQVWASLALPLSLQFATAINWSLPRAWVESNLFVTDGPHAGYRFSSQSTPDDVWFEGTSQLAVLAAVQKDSSRYAAALQNVEFARLEHTHGNGQGLVAASSDGLMDTNFDGIVYDTRLHVGASAWLVFAEKQYNPFNIATTAVLSAADTALLEGSTGTTNAAIAVTLSTPSAQTVTVAYSTSSLTATTPTDYSATSGTLTFNPGSATQIVTVVVQGEMRNEANEAFQLNLTSPSGATIARGVALITVLNDDSIWQNPGNLFDVSGDGSVSSIDLIEMIDALNSRGPVALPLTGSPPAFIDINGDTFLSSIDLLLLIDELNSESPLSDAA